MGSLLPPRVGGCVGWPVRWLLVSLPLRSVPRHLHSFISRVEVCKLYLTDSLTKQLPSVLLAGGPSRRLEGGNKREDIFFPFFFFFLFVFCFRQLSWQQQPENELPRLVLQSSGGETLSSRFHSRDHGLLNSIVFFSPLADGVEVLSCSY